MATSIPSFANIIAAGGKNSTIACARSTAAGKNYSGDELVSAITSSSGATISKQINGVTVAVGTPPIMVIGVEPSDTPEMNLQLTGILL